MPRLRDRRFRPDCVIEVDGRPFAAREGESVAAALLAAGVVVLARSAKYHRPRGAFCLAGSCHACLARVDGLPNQRTCRIACRPGLVVETQNAIPTARHDLLGAIDVLYARGLDHHHLMTWNPIANRAAVALSRRIAGTGTLAGRPVSPAPPAIWQRFDAVVIGAGPAGLAAAEALAARGARVLLAESERVMGGRLRAQLGDPGDPAPGWILDVQQAIVARGGEPCTRLTALGIWHDGGAPVAALQADDGGALRLVRASSIVVATGTHALPPAFPRGDLPGIFAGRAIARLLLEDGIVPAGRCVVAGPGAERERVAVHLRRAGPDVVETADVTEAIGGRRLRAVVAGGRSVRCATLIWCGPRAPASDLARQGGAAVDLDAHGGWRVRVDPRGATGTPGISAAGEVVAEMGAGEAIASGWRAGEGARVD